MLKSETADIPILEAVCLAPKTYSVLLDNEKAKNTAKGVNHSEKIKLKHDLYRQVHDGTLNNVTATCSNIRSKNNILYTLISKKAALVKVERKRYWLNAVDSVAFDHPSIKKASTTIAMNDKIYVEKQSVKRKHEDGGEYPLTLTYKRIQNVQDFGS